MGMLVYGIAKVMQFKGAVEVDKFVSEMTGMELMWAFYGYSRPFQLLLGVLEVSGGLLILFKRTRLIGGILATTILVNIILQDIFYGVNQGALQAAILYQVCIFGFFWLNKTQIIKTLQVLTQNKIDWSDKKRLFIKLSFAFFLFVVFRIAEFYLTRMAWF